MINDTSVVLEIFPFIVDHAPITIVITDADARILYVNKRFEQVTGYKQQEAIGKTPRILKSGRMNSEVYKQLWNNLKSGKAWKGDFINKTKNDIYFWEKASIFPVSYNNQIFYVKLAEVKSESYELWNLVLDLFSRAEYFILVIDKDMTIKMCNQNFASCVTGLSSNEIIGMNYLDLIPDSSRLHVKLLYENLINKTTNKTQDVYQEIVYELECKQGNIYIVKWFVAIVNSDANLVLHLGTIYEETDKFKLDSEQLRQHYKMLLSKDRTFINLLKTVVK